MEKKVKVVIFDLDGTLVNTIDDIASANNKVLANHGFETHKVADYVNFIGNGARNLVRLSLPVSMANDERAIEILLAEYKAEYKAALCIKSSLYKGVADLISTLKASGVKVAVNTNKPHDQSVLLLDMLFGNGVFDCIQGQLDDVPRKPAPDGALIIAEKFGVEVSNCVYIGDSSVDTRTASAAGMMHVGVTWGYGNHADMKAFGCKLFANTCEELSSVIAMIR